MTIGTTIQVAQATSAANSATLATVAAFAVPAGATVSVALANEGPHDPLAVTDGVGNGYVPSLNEISGNGGSLQVYRCVNCLAIPAGTAITGTWNTAFTGQKHLIAVAAPGIIQLDREAIGAKGLDISPTINSGTLAQNAGERAFVFLFLPSGGTLMDDPNWTANASISGGASALYVDEYPTVSASGVFYGAALSTAKDWSLKMWVFQGAAGASSFCALPTPIAPITVPTRFGYQYSTNDDSWIVTAKALTAVDFRIGVNLFLTYLQDSQEQIELQAIVNKCAANGLKLVLDVKYNPLDGAGHSTLPAGYTDSLPPSLTVYRANLARVLDICGSIAQLVCVGNETNGNFVPIGTLPAALVPGYTLPQYDTYYTAVRLVASDTYNAYMTVLNAACDVVLGRGAYLGQTRLCKITGSGVSDSGMTRAMWHYVYLNEPISHADEFVSVTSQGQKGLISGDLPSAQVPTRSIFALNPNALYGMLISEMLMQGDRAAGCHFFNMHVFWDLPDPCWINRQVAFGETQGLPVVLTATGQKTEDPYTTIALMYLLAFRQPASFSVFGAATSARAFPYANADGTLNIRGEIVAEAFKNYNLALGRNALTKIFLNTDVVVGPNDNLLIARGDGEGVRVGAFQLLWQGQPVQRVTPVSGDAVTVQDQATCLIVDPTTTLATLAVTLPALPYNNQRVTITATQTISALSLSANVGQIIVNPITTLDPPTSVTYIYLASNTTWYPL